MSKFIILILRLLRCYTNERKFIRVFYKLTLMISLALGLVSAMSTVPRESTAGITEGTVLCCNYRCLTEVEPRALRCNRRNNDPGSSQFPLQEEREPLIES